jgi:hypothetical protein
MYQHLSADIEIPSHVHVCRIDPDTVSMCRQHELAELSNVLEKALVSADASSTIQSKIVSSPDANIGQQTMTLCNVTDRLKHSWRVQAA